jgi:hypothetical protein
VAPIGITARSCANAAMTSLRRLAWVLMAGSSLALAADVSYIAETASTSLRQGAVNAGNVAWQCDGVRCVGIGPWATPPQGLCVALAREVGTLRVFAQFAPREVAACNEAAAGGKQPDAPKAAPPSKAPPKASPGSGQA